MNTLAKVKPLIGSQRDTQAFLGQLNSTTMESLCFEIEAEFYWKKRQPHWFSDSRKSDALVRKLHRRIKKALAKGRVPPERSASGAVVKRSTAGSLDYDRYGRIFLSSYQLLYCDGASAVWKSDADRVIVTYTEGDIVELICSDEQQYEIELDVIARFYGL